jgi:hypothetical protein
MFNSSAEAAVAKAINAAQPNRIIRVSDAALWPIGPPREIRRSNRRYGALWKFSIARRPRKYQNKKCDDFSIEKYDDFSASRVKEEMK